MGWAFKKGIKSYYNIGDTLGTGSFATVKLGVHKKTKDEVAIKIIDKKDISDMEENLQTEIDILRKVDHPHIIGLIDIYDTSKKLYLVMELVTGGELFDSIVDRGSYSEADAAKVIRETLTAIKYLHDLGIVHRDLKPENLLYSTKDPVEQVIKIADFGLAKIVGDDSVMTTTCGTPGYVAPEVLMNKGYDKAVDLWSIGVILYILLCGFPPFYSENTPQLFDQIMRGDYDFPSPYWDHISESGKDLVKRLLVVDPRKRLNVEETLAHPWVKGETANKDAIPDIVDTMKRFNAKRKLKQGILGVMAMNQMKRLADSLGKK
eukprot:CAMPEP_0113880712 /NCGR_PEP_ID=MMETSP0780_2-20120614/7944_1 /TAXON_ID=652834 /ORGANISM="Palpitomonas bilix" /LENGTH=319 /DNA_ID=CAMNT_0000867431 /DNA_START=110 /DNA_END=1069 /DNA_ORIENTATION=+ /assembly_acc=CAM_ASM_000599